MSEPPSSTTTGMALRRATRYIGSMPDRPAIDDSLEAWLAEAGLVRLADAFRTQDIDRAHLPRLTDTDLRELGLTIGERKRFRDALRAEAAAAGTLSEVATLAERRPLTLMFVDLVDSTGLSERLDVEDLLEVILLYRNHCGVAIERYGGHIAQLVGDGILAYFCYPIAHENDCERAIRAALDIVDTIGDVATPAGQKLRVRIGVATGRVIISDLLSGGAADLRTVTGSTPNLASRLQRLAPANGIVVSELTHERIAGLFACDDLGLHALQGFSAPQHAFQVLRAVPERGAQAHLAGRLTPLFARERELSALAARWERCRGGMGGVALIGGEAGIGKSRLVERFLGTLVGRDAAIVRIASSPFDQDSPLRPFLAHLRVAADLDDDDAAEDKLDKLGAILRGPEAASDLPILAELLSLRADPASDALSPAALRERGLAAVARQLLALASEAPLCLAVEDLHWLDPTSRDLLARIAASIAARPVLLLLTTRDPADRAWLPTGPDDAVLTLDRLGTSDVAGMVQSLFGDQPVPASVARQIALKTDGVPLFIEEYVRPLLRARVEVDWSRVAADEADPVAIPASLHEALMAQLDRAAHAKSVAQVVAVIGRLARRDVLAAACGLPQAELDAALAVLAAAGILRPHSEDGRDCYAFGHALVRDAAYDSLLRDRRRELHARVAEALAALDPDGVELQPELLALHLTEGGLVDEAVTYWLKAGNRSVRRSALLEATRLLRRGLAAAETLPASPANRERRLQLMALLGPVLIALRGPGSAEAQAHYTEAYALARDSRESRSHFPVLWGWWRLSRDFGIMRQRAATLLSRAAERDDPELLLQAHHCNWASHYNEGDLPGCIGHIHAGMAIYEGNDYRDHAALYGNHDARVCAHGELAQIYWMQGRLREAAAEEARSLRWAGSLGHLGSRAHAFDMALLHRSYLRDHAAVLRHADELLDFTAHHGLADHRSKGLIFRGWAIAMAGDPLRGLDALESGLARQREIGTVEDFPIYLCLHAEALAAAGQADRAVDELTLGQAGFAQVGLQIWQPEVWRSLGSAILAADPAATDAAGAAFARAAAAAAEQGTAMLGVRIAGSEAALAVRQDRPEWAHGRLRAALAAIPDGESGPEIEQARAALHALHRRLGLNGTARCGC